MSECKKGPKIMLHLPKFKLEHQFSAKDLLMNLGMKDVFVDGVADLSGISGNKDLHVSQVGELYTKKCGNPPESWSIRRSIFGPILRSSVYR